MSAMEQSDYLKVAAEEGWLKSATQKRSSDMCERILEAAFVVFSEKGYRDTNIVDITGLAGCSVGIFYKRFTDKEGLFFTLQHRHFSGSRARFDMITDARDTDTTADIFRGFVNRSRKFMFANTGFIKAQVELALKNPKVADARKANLVYAADRLMQVLVSRGELPDSKELRKKLELAVRVVFATLTHMVLFGPGPYPIKDKRVLENLTDILVGFLHEEQDRLGIL
jgi:AcrR family transcriptional regulator